MSRLQLQKNVTSARLSAKFLKANNGQFKIKYFIGNYREFEVQIYAVAIMSQTY